MHELLLSLFIQGLYETYVKHLNTQTTNRHTHKYHILQLNISLSQKHDSDILPNATAVG